MTRTKVLVSVGIVGFATLSMWTPDVAGQRVATGCPAALPGPELVFIPAPGSPFCVDAREISQSDYARFIAATEQSAPTQSQECQKNEHFLPLPQGEDYARGGTGYCPGGWYDPEKRGDHAMTCVDWCDAKAYCEWAGKRLCASRGQGSVSLESRLDPAESEWQYACTAGGKTRFPYGNAYQAGRCVDAVDATARTRDRSFSYKGNPQCSGPAPFDRLRDMVGSVAEWTASCDTQKQYCAIQGGSFAAEQAACDATGITGRWETMQAVGFRCCAEATEGGR